MLYYIIKEKYLHLYRNFFKIVDLLSSTLNNFFIIKLLT